MKVRTFREKVDARITEVDSCVCLGLDSDYQKLPACVKAGGFKESALRFNRAHLEASHRLLAAVKFNAAFYESHGAEGKIALKASVEHCREIDPGLIVIVDYKRADIGNSSLGYAREGFSYYEADAVTVNPYFGREATQPFLDQRDKGVMVLCKTSNPGGGEFQDFVGHPPSGPADELARLLGTEGNVNLYQYVAYQVARQWNQHGNCGLVVGATYPRQAATVRRIVGDMPLLVPGIGQQQGALKETVAGTQDSRGRGLLINSSRGIIFAGADKSFAQAGAEKAAELKNESNRYRKRPA